MSSIQLSLKDQEEQEEAKIDTSDIILSYITTSRLKDKNCLMAGFESGVVDFYLFPAVRHILRLDLLPAPITSLASYAIQNEIFLLAGFYHKKSLICSRILISEQSEKQALSAQEVERQEGNSITEAEGIGGIKWMKNFKEKRQFVISGFDKVVRIVEWKDMKVMVRQSYREHTKRICSIDTSEEKIVSTGEEGKLVVRKIKE